MRHATYVSHTRHAVSAAVLAGLFLFPVRAYAVCPVCTVAVAAGLGLSRWLGIDDTVSGVWIGGLMLSSSLWLSSWLTKKNVRLPFLSVWASVLTYATVIVPLILTGIIGHPRNTLWGIDKIVLGIAAGTVLFLAGVLLDRIARVTNGGRVRFFYQKVVFPVSLLVLGSGILYFVTRR